MDEAFWFRRFLPLYDEPEVRERIQKDIDTYRKKDYCLKLKADRPGKVTVRQRKHAFHFGCSLFLLDEMETPEKNRRFEENFTGLFNYATLPIYWKDLEPERGKPRFAADSPRIYRRPPVDKCVDFCRKNGIFMKAHCLYYEPHNAPWAAALPPEEFEAALEHRFAEIAERYRDVIPEFEVTNELNSHYWEDHHPNETTAYRWDPDCMNRTFRLARKYFPENKLISNEGMMCGFYPALNHHETQYIEQLRTAISHGAPIDYIGFQGHFIWCSSEVLQPKVVYDTMQLFTENFHRPVQITECTFPAYFNDGVLDEDLQAEVTEKFYSILFSCPAVNAIIYWNLTDGYAYGAEPGDMTAGENVWQGGLCRFDGSRKPAYEVLDRLINREWHTEFTEEVAPEIRFRGFLGEYEACIRYEDGTEERQTFTIR